jgi:beta-alanine degradation protein BauB
MEPSRSAAPTIATHPSKGVTMSAARVTAVADNDQVRVATWTFEEDGAATGEHHHDFDYIVVPITGGRFTVTDADGTVHELEQVAGVPYLRSAGATHDVVNRSGREAVFVEIELKR